VLQDVLDVAPVVARDFPTGQGLNPPVIVKGIEEIILAEP
jgi:hypothetical protein